MLAAMKSYLDIETKAAQDVQKPVLRISLALTACDIGNIRLAHTDEIRRLLLRQLAAPNLTVYRVHQVGFDKQLVSILETQIGKDIPATLNEAALLLTALACHDAPGRL
jgi:hypothetical protein